MFDEINVSPEESDFSLVVNEARAVFLDRLQQTCCYVHVVIYLLLNTSSDFVLRTSSSEGVGDDAVATLAIERSRSEGFSQCKISACVYELGVTF